MVGTGSWTKLRLTNEKYIVYNTLKNRKVSQEFSQPSSWFLKEDLTNKEPAK